MDKRTIKLVSYSSCILIGDSIEYSDVFNQSKSVLEKWRELLMELMVEWLSSAWYNLLTNWMLLPWQRGSFLNNLNERFSPRIIYEGLNIFVRGKMNCVGLLRAESMFVNKR